MSSPGILSADLDGNVVLSLGNCSPSLNLAEVRKLHALLEDHLDTLDYCPECDPDGDPCAEHEANLQEERDRCALEEAQGHGS